MGKFAEFLKEQDNEKPYRLLNLIHDTPDDPNKTGDMIEKEAKKMGIVIDAVLLEKKLKSDPDLWNK